MTADRPRHRETGHGENIRRERHVHEGRLCVLLLGQFEPELDRVKRRC